MNDLHKDILTGSLFITGLVGFISGEFILSTVLFALAAIISSGCIPEHCKVMASGTCHNTQVPNEVAISQARIGH
jgi:hypothetical protein